jgi:hypothetical protein
MPTREGLRESGLWIQTAAGRVFPLLAPEPGDVCLYDIALSLAHQVRFTGHVGGYSIAQHSVHVAEVVYGESGDLELAFAGLMHDAHEAYVGDVSSPLKRAMRLAVTMTSGPVDEGGYDQLERMAAAAVRARYGLAYSLPPVAKRADLVMLATEARDLLGPTPKSWSLDLPEPRADMRIVPWSAETAEWNFRAAFDRLCPIDFRSEPGERGSSVDF